MGCDIHGWVERKVGDKWVAERELPDAATNRNYERFAALAGVRGDGPEARGLPTDISDTARMHANDWGVDGHSHSWLPVADALPIFLETARGLTDWAQRYPSEEFFGVDIDERHEWRIVFWFDN